MNKKNRYSELIEAIFQDHFVSKGEAEFHFTRDEIARQARKLRIKLPKNIGDLVYSFRYRTQLPMWIRDLAGDCREWVIRPAGRGRYHVACVGSGRNRIEPRTLAPEIKIPDATPGIIAKHALSDEQALLAKIRYNRLLDIFCRVATYSLQSHLRSQVQEMGQVETDEVYVGIHRCGAQFVLPVQAKGRKDKLSLIQIEQDLALCKEKFPDLICRPIGAQFLRDGCIVLFEFKEIEGELKVISEEHYRLVPPESISSEELKSYAALIESDLIPQ
jgi:hypothetical protein